MPTRLLLAALWLLQWLPLQTWPLVHATPHAPQWAGLERVSTQAPEQSVSGAEHVVPIQI